MDASWTTAYAAMNSTETCTCRLCVHKVETCAPMHVTKSADFSRTQFGVRQMATRCSTEDILYSLRLINQPLQAVDITTIKTMNIPS